MKLVAALPGIEYIEAEDVRRSPFRVAVTPLPSLHAALREAAGAKASGMPVSWSESIRRHLTAQDYATLAPLVTPGATLIPDPLVGLADPPGESLKDGIERMMATPAEFLGIELLDRLLVTGGVQGERWYCPCEFYEGRVRFPEDGVVLMPLLAGERRQVLVRRGEVMETIIYPLRSLPEVAHREPPDGALEALLGAPRAAILRALGCPISIGRLAETLRSVPSAATHHVSALEAAGLVTRDRTGRHVLVRRTERGEALLALYEELDLPSRVRRRRSA